VDKRTYWTGGWIWIVLLLTGPALAQQKIPKIAQNGVGRWVYGILNDTSSAESSRILVVPTFGYAPETSAELGVRVFSLFYVNKDTVVNRLSEIALYSFITTRLQFGSVLDNAVYSNKNKYFFLGRTRYQQFPLLYYGIGPDAPLTNPVTVESEYFQFRQRVLRNIVNNWYAGLEIDFQRLGRVNFENSSREYDFPVGAQGSTSSGVGAAIVYDDRKNVLNVRKGNFLEAGFLTYSGALGSTYPFRSYLIDARMYRPLGNRKRILAAQVFGTFMNGTVPFNNLAMLGGSELLRGYYQGRYRDKNLMAIQAEVRWLPFGFSRRWGGTAFAGLGTVAPTLATFRKDQFRWTVGGGVRFLFFQRKDVYLRGDVGLTAEGTGIYFSLGEAF
jgi:hypothetical protein